jgi:hypothetical protein
MNQYWQNYYTIVLDGGVKIWISIAAVCILPSSESPSTDHKQAAFASLGGTIVVLATIFHRISSSVLIPIECLCMCAMATAFGTSLSFTYTLDPFSKKRLDTVDSPDLMMFGMLVDLSRGYVITACAGWFLSLCACITAAVEACSRARAKESCSFEPTASALGMGYGYAAIVPPAVRSRVPSIYDPQLPLDDLSPKASHENEKGLTGKDLGMGRADSVVSEEGGMSFSSEKNMTTKPDKALHVRPTKPWSVISGRDDEVHNM